MLVRGQAALLRSIAKEMGSIRAAVQGARRPPTRMADLAKSGSGTLGRRKTIFKFADKQENGTCWI